ncbi:MAG: cardiolipin synthase [Clostridia bacterium]|nr:cardiolipin synthase [Clostridia bacterium]
MKKFILKKIKYIPLRFTFAMLLIIAEILAIIGIVVVMCYFVPYFYLLALLTQVSCVIKIIASDDNPDYKVPWLFIVMLIPIAGFMPYFMFSERKLSSRYRKRLKDLYSATHGYNDDFSFSKLKEQDLTAYNQFSMVKKISGACLFDNPSLKYYGDIELLRKDLLVDLENAKNFIFLEFFIIQKGVFWDSVLEILVKKASQGVDVRVLYDDIGCMQTLPAYYDRKLKKLGIKALQFSRLRGNADGEFNNRNHRKILVIDGVIGYTGGFNLADEYVNKIERFGHWKDSGLRLEGNAVFELTKTFASDYYLNCKKQPDFPENLYPLTQSVNSNGFIMPFGDGPKPVYERAVSKSVIQNLLSSAKRYAYITTPYLIVDNDLLSDIENTALRGVDVRIILPSIPDKKIVNVMSKSYYARLLSAGVKIYEYSPGFIHAKTYLVDDEYAMVGTVNLDYRSLVHHFENGVLMYRADVLNDVKSDILSVLEKSIEIKKSNIKNTLFKRFISSLVRIFAPLL